MHQRSNSTPRVLRDRERSRVKYLHFPEAEVAVARDSEHDRIELTSVVGVSVSEPFTIPMHLVPAVLEAVDVLSVGDNEPDPAVPVSACSHVALAFAGGVAA